MKSDAKERVSAIREVLKRSKRISVSEMDEVAQVAQQHGGALVSVDGDGDWCGTGRIRIPKKGGIGPLVDALVERGLVVNVGLINGIPPFELHVDIEISRDIAAR